MKRIITIISTVLMSLVASAQKYNVDNFDLCGIKPGTILTKSEIIKKFGNPTSINQDKNIEDGSICATTYYFDNLVIEIDKKYGLSLFAVYSSDYPVATTMVNKEGIKVGDSMDVLKRYPFTTPQIRPELKNAGYRQLDADWYSFFFTDQTDDTRYHVQAKNGKIVSIWLHINTTDY